MVDQLGQRKMNRDKALSSTYTSVLKIYAKVIGISPHGLIGPAEKNVAKKKKKWGKQPRPIQTFRRLKAKSSNRAFMLSLKYYLTGILYNNNF